MGKMTNQKQILLQASNVGKGKHSQNAGNTGGRDNYLQHSSSPITKNTPFDLDDDNGGHTSEESDEGSDPPELTKMVMDQSNDSIL